MYRTMLDELVMSDGDPEIPPGNPPEAPPQETPIGVPPGNPPEVPEPPGEIPGDVPPEVPPPPSETSAASVASCMLIAWIFRRVVYSMTTA